VSHLAILGIALALAMDAFAVSIASGIAIHNLRVHHALLIAGCFGFFQALMPLLGWLAGLRLHAALAAADHWVAFALLAGVGTKMICESFKLESVERRRNPLDVYVLLVLAVATSIDALAAGLSFAFLNVSIVEPALVAGAVTFATCYAGVWIGDRFGHFFEKKMELAAGIGLVAIGLKILLAHLAGGA
jgi:manganese efflux pump family protein